MRDILIIGSLNMDMVILTPHIPLAGETISGKFSAYLPGGKGANQAYAAGKLGASAAMLGAVGKDPFGETLIKSLRSVNVGTDLIKSGDVQTGEAIIYVSDSGENSIVVIPGANHTCDAGFILAHEAEIASSRFVMLQMEIPFDGVAAAIELASRNGCIVVLNPAPAVGPLPESLLAKIDYLTPNETELSILAGLPVRNTTEAVEAARALIKAGVRCVLATLGDKGALCVTEDSDQLFPARPVKAVDTTAAGDTFNAAFIVRKAEGASNEDAIQFANTAASISVTRPGAQPSIPTREETERVLQGGSVK